MFCPTCGQQVPDNSTFCFRCGTDLTVLQQQQQVQQPQGQSRNQLPQGQPQYPQYPPYGGQPYLPPQYGYGYPAPMRHPLTPPPVQIPEKVDDPTPDPKFTKFEEAEAGPLPFRLFKKALAGLSILGAGYLIYGANKLGTFLDLKAHVKTGIPGVALLIMAALLIVAAVCGLISNKKRGPAAIGGICYLFVAGLGFIYEVDFPPKTIYAIVAVACAIIFLISDAGGVHINLDD